MRGDPICHCSTALTIYSANVQKSSATSSAIRGGLASSGLIAYGRPVRLALAKVAVD